MLLSIYLKIKTGVITTPFCSDSFLKFPITYRFFEMRVQYTYRIKEGSIGMYKIYIIEDDANIASLIVEHLAKYQFECFTVQQFPHIIEEFNTIQPHRSLWISISRLTMAILVTENPSTLNMSHHHCLCQIK